MIRCHSARAHLALAALCLPALFFAALAPRHAVAQEAVRREAPRDVVLGKMSVVAPPVIQIDGKPDRLSPGSRIRDVRNMLVLSGNLAGQTVPVVYRREPNGQVHEVWLLTEEEYRKLGGRNPSTGDGVRQFAELLAAIFGARP